MLFDMQEVHGFVDSQNISAHTQQSLRSQIAYVPQEVSHFHRSTSENIAYGTRVRAARRPVTLGHKQTNAPKLFDRLPAGFDTMVGERGMRLSGRPAPAHRPSTAQTLANSTDPGARRGHERSAVNERPLLENLMRGHASITTYA